nr:reverse transcriptase domain-containing protein [Tanacetum cinerariifolium]
MFTRSDGQPAAVSLGGGTCVRVGRGGKGRRPREEGVNGNVEGANGGESDFSTIIAKQLQNILPAMLAQGGAIVLTRWIEKIESVHDMSDCCIDQKVKYTAGSFVGKASTWWNSQILELSQLVQLYPIGNVVTNSRVMPSWKEIV